MERSSRVISKKNAVEADILFCIQKDQLQFASHIITTQGLLDVIHLRGLEEYEALTPMHKPQNTKHWSPYTWAFYSKKLDYLKLLFEQSPSMQPHLSHCLDITSGLNLLTAEDSFDLAESLDERYLNKGRMQGLLICVAQRNWEMFKYTLDRTYKHLLGWHLFQAARAFVEAQWFEGLVMFFNDDKVQIVLGNIPLRNKKDLVGSMLQHMKLKVKSEDFEQVRAVLTREVESSKIAEHTTAIFDYILNDYQGPIEKIVNENGLASLNFCCAMTGKDYRGGNRAVLEAVEKTSIKMSTQKLEKFLFEKLNPVTLSIVSNAQRCLEYFLSLPTTSLLYACAKPGAYDLSDTCFLRH